MGSIMPLPSTNSPEEPPPTRRSFSLAIPLVLVACVLVWFFVIDPLPPGGPFYTPPPNPRAVQGFSAQWSLGKQWNRSEEVKDEILRLNDQGDLVGMARVARSRLVELNAEIGRVEVSTDYSVSDKQKMLKALDAERQMLRRALAAAGF